MTIPNKNDQFPRRSTSHVLRDLLRLSRFDRYNPLFATFAGVWSTLLAGAEKLADDRTSTSYVFISRQTFLCFLASYIFCGAGMVWNDWIDRDIDANVARTKDRPLAAGRLKTGEAMLWMMVQVAVSWGILQIMLSGKDVWSVLLPAAVASILYPYGKRPLAQRFHLYPQYILGFTIAWPAIAGCAAIHNQKLSFGEIAHHCLPLCTMIFFWTLYLNTAYSYQDVVDDRKMGVNSFYNLAGKHIHLFLVMLATTVLLLRFDGSQPTSGGTLHKENFLLGVWTVAICMVEVFLRAGNAPMHISVFA
ncbi:hypothetical protein EYZ11_011712 [Aspergillus tanneri]|uniref:Uncharacterized protein n=1 Tax=Aspergillus tanneri TaxID=1220188 RepID=A0A4S3J487_9EURO|nr:hypothetical protein EYZ11_011712 [Aspergillus tanneri]